MKPVLIGTTTFFCLGTIVALAQTGGSFQTTGSMITSRWGHTATLLPNGKVLIAGGVTPGSALTVSSAELYDPATGVFTAAGDMITPRAFHTATLLPDGKVLIAGGPRTGAAELYDPSTGTFSATGNMVQAGRGTAILLPDGRVLIAHAPLGPSYAPAELYDTASGTFSDAGNQLLFWGGTHQASLLADGRVLLATCCTTEQLYDPASGAFSLTGAMVGTCEDGFAMAPLPNGAILFSGGYCEESNLSSPGAALYSAATGIFNPTGQMSQGRYFHTATQLGDGKVLIAGSQAPNASVYYVSSAEVYNPASSTFSPTGNMTVGRSGHTATLLLDGTVLITGGIGGVNGGGISGINVGLLASAEIYTPPVRIPAPALFSLSADGQGQGAIWHAATRQVASGDNPATAGEALSMYTINLVHGGVLPPQVAVGGRLAEILFFGEAPGYPGYFQVNFRVPNGVGPGSAAPVRLSYFGRSSNEVTIGVHQ